jgi:hypothetical protein
VPSLRLIINYYVGEKETADFKLRLLFDVLRRKLLVALGLFSFFRIEREISLMQIK